MENFLIFGSLKMKIYFLNFLEKERKKNQQKIFQQEMRDKIYGRNIRAGLGHILNIILRTICIKSIHCIMSFFHFNISMLFNLKYFFLKTIFRLLEWEWNMLPRCTIVAELQRPRVKYLWTSFLCQPSHPEKSRRRKCCVCTLCLYKCCSLLITNSWEIAMKIKTSPLLLCLHT